MTDEAATLLAAKLKTLLQIGRHLVRAFEAGFEIGGEPMSQRGQRGPFKSDVETKHFLAA